MNNELRKRLKYRVDQFANCVAEEDETLSPAERVERRLKSDEAEERIYREAENILMEFLSRNVK